MNENGRVRFVRLLVFFDLPVETAAQRKRYRLFRKHLLDEGFLMLQESVYSKLVVNDASFKAVVERMRQQCPSDGLVQVLRVTEKQYATMESLTGKVIQHDEVDSMEGFLVL